MAPLADISRVFGQQQSSEPISRTMQYRKITKPLLERQRRARINRCLDELKDILISGLQSEGENVARLEKADILELTVRHLQKLTNSHKEAEEEKLALLSRPIGDDERFRAGFAKCAQEVSKALAQNECIQENIQIGTSLMIHLGHALNQMSTRGTVVESPKCSPISSYEYRPYTPPSSPESYYTSSNMGEKNVWRPW